MDYMCIESFSCTYLTNQFMQSQIKYAGVKFALHEVQYLVVHLDVS